MRSLLALAVTAPLLLVACSGAPVAEEPSSSLKPQGFTGAPADPSATPTDAPTEASPSVAPQPAKPEVGGMATDRFADAVLEQIKIDSPDTFSDQLITIALSPLLRQLASSADVTTRVASKGPKVTLTLTGKDGSCVVTVTDEPRARGVVCKAA